MVEILAGTDPFCYTTGELNETVGCMNLFTYGGQTYNRTCIHEGSTRWWCYTLDGSYGYCPESCPRDQCKLDTEPSKPSNYENGEQFK